VTVPAVCSQEAAVTWTMVMVVARSTGVTPTMAEVMTTMSMAGGVTMSKTWVDADWVAVGSLD
jgi:hypothetical protein